MTQADIINGKYLKVGDTEPDLEVQLVKDSDVPKDVSDAQDIFIHLERANGDEINPSGTVVKDDAVNGRVSYQWDATDTEKASTVVGEFVVVDGSGEQSTYPNRGEFHVFIEEGVA